MSSLVDQINYGASNPTGVYMQNASSGYQVPQGITGPGVGQVAAPQVGGANNNLSTPLGMNLGTGQLVLGSVGTIGNLWSAWQAQKLAKDQFNYQKGITDTNLANQIQSYNTALTDRINARGFTQGDSQSTIDQYIEKNSLRDRRNG